MNRRTPLYETHLAAGARIVPFGGWDMPLHYGSQLEEHHAVRRDAGVFDVSHMTVVDLSGSGAAGYLARLLANDPGKLTTPGRGLYSCMLRETGGVVDDLIVYLTAPSEYRLVLNAATRDKDLAWIEEVAGDHPVEIAERELAMLAVQGPRALAIVSTLLPARMADALRDLRPFGCIRDGQGPAALFVARTGYTGEDGCEIILPSADAPAIWEQLVERGARPCGLGARDTLRLEAGLPLYGQDMDEDTSPLVAGLAWTVAFEPPGRDFIGREALERQRQDGLRFKQAGLLLEDRGIMRHGQRVHTPCGDGVITSGGFSPTMERSIALARVPAGAEGACEVDIRGTLRAARLVKPPFVRHGRVRIES